MNPERRDFLNLTNLPARMGIREAAWFLGFTEHDISVLVSKGILKPLGRPPRTGSKYFATAQLQMYREDATWLARASDATVTYWKSKNSGRQSPLAIDQN